jgi:cytochrome P450
LVRDIIINFAIAGRDTTAILSTWAVYCLMKNPKVLDRVKDEVKSVGRLPTTEDIANLKYLGYTLSETLRLYPSVPSVG